MNTLKRAVRQKVERQSLDTAQITHLLELQAQSKTTHRIAVCSSHALLSWSLAASLLLVSVLFFSYLPTDKTDRVQAIAQEVVKNHLHQKPLEIESPRLAMVSPYFDRLDFRPIESQYLESEKYQLLGGRYCSLQGITAAQLRYSQVGSKHKQTLYQVGYDPQVFSELPDIGQHEQPVVTYVNGIQVSIWVEHGILFALTTEE